MELLREDLATLARAATDEALAFTLAQAEGGLVAAGVFHDDFEGRMCGCPTALLVRGSDFGRVTPDTFPIYLPSRWDEAAEVDNDPFLVPADHPANRLLIEVVRREQARRRFIRAYETAQSALGEMYFVSVEVTG